MHDEGINGKGLILTKKQVKDAKKVNEDKRDVEI